MANVITPDMSLIVPTIGSEPSPNYAQDINNSLVIIDSHNHTPGSGVFITPAAININTALSMNNNSLTTIAALTLSAQSATPANGSLYESGVDLYYVDGNGTVVRITSGGVVNATSSGISSGTATASFSAGVLVVDSNVATPANIQGGSILLGNNVANSKYLTLSPPNAMSANYGLQLPSLPTSTGTIQMDTSGNMISRAYVQGIVKNTSPFVTPTIIAGSGFSVTSGGLGSNTVTTTITFNTPFSSAISYVATATASAFNGAPNPPFCTIEQNSGSSMVVRMFYDASGDSGIGQFSFTAFAF